MIPSGKRVKTSAAVAAPVKPNVDYPRPRGDVSKTIQMPSSMFPQSRKTSKERNEQF
jgi:hypothetical protein